MEPLLKGQCSLEIFVFNGVEYETHTEVYGNFEALWPG
jgi:hypothetical protein